MEITISTETLKSLATKASRGASGNSLLPITELIEIRLERGKFSLTTTDGTNFLSVSRDDIDGDDLVAVVRADMFCKLVSKFTCAIVNFNLTDSYLEVIGNGKYKLDLVLDENGEMVKYPRPDETCFLNKTPLTTGKISLSVLEEVLQYARPALAEKIEMQPYTEYYFGNGIFATNGNVICKVDTIPWAGYKLLIGARLLDLFESVSDEEIEYAFDEKEILFTSANARVYGKLPQGIDVYKIREVDNLTTQEFDSSCVISRSALLQALDRISLFVEKGDMGAVTLEFGNDLAVSSIQCQGVDKLEFVEQDGADYGYGCKVAVEILTKLVKSNTADTVKIYYGGDSRALKLESGNIIQLIAVGV